MNSENSVNNFLTLIEKDFKAEVIAAEIAEHGVPVDQIVMMMLGAGKRSFRKEIDSVEDELFDYDRKEHIIVKAVREGLYDMLPEGLFDPATAHKSIHTEKEIIASIKQRREEERNARTFFLPFEAAINHLRIQLALYENRLDKSSHYNDLVSVFAGQWKIFNYLDEQQANIFLHLIPIIHDLRDDHSAIETILEMMFLLPVKISMRMQASYHPLQPVISQLNKENILGVNITTGNIIYMSGEDEIVITIGPMHNSMLKEFMQGEKKAIALELLCDYLLPIHVDIVTEFVLNEQDKTTRLADKENDYNCVLGSDTYL